MRFLTLVYLYLLVSPPTNTIVPVSLEARVEHLYSVLRSEVI